MDDITATVNQKGKLADILDNLDEGSRNFADGFTNFEKGSRNFRTVMANIQKGEGSLGKILVKDDFYLRISSLMSKAEVILNDVNHYEYFSI